MYVRRDYSQPFFGAGRRKRGRGRRWLTVLLVVGALGIFVATQAEMLRSMAMDALGLSPIPTALSSELATQAMEAYFIGDLKQASDLFERALAQRPDNVDYLYEYGLILIELEDYDRAIELGDRAIVANAFDARGFALKSRALVWAGRASEALPVALTGLELDRRYAPLYSVMARAYIALGNIPAGLENAEMAVELDALSSDARRSYAYALSSTASHDEAVEQLELAISMDPGNIQAYMELAFQYLARDRDEEAIDLYTDILSRQPRNARAMLRLCMAYRKVGQFDRALDACEQAVSADPAYVAAQFRLGMIQYTDRNYAQAQTAFRDCVNLQPDNIECKYRLGLTHFYLGDCDASWRILNEALLEAQQRTVAEDVMTNIRLGLTELSQNCTAYFGRVTPLPPTDDPDRGLQPIIGLTPVMDETLDASTTGEETGQTEGN